jgi:hypothetical protein
MRSEHTLKGIHGPRPEAATREGNEPTAHIRQIEPVQHSWAEEPKLAIVSALPAL